MKLFKNKTFSLFVGFILLLNIIVPTSFADNTEWEDSNPGIKDEQTDEGELGMVVSAHPLASEVGAEILREGGNAVDAAIAMQFALNVAEPMMSGIGGGGFMMYYDAASEDISIINSRERAPSGATPDMFLDKSKNVTGPGGLLLGAIDLSPKEEGDGEFHIGELSLTDLDSEKNVFQYDFKGEVNTSWSTEKFALDERGTTFTLDEEGGKIAFGPARGSNKSSLGLTTAKIDPLENSELFLRFKTDNPGEDKRIRTWLRADEYRSGSTYAKNGLGIEINTNNNTVSVIQSKESNTTTLETIDMKASTDWQSLRFQVEGNNLKVKLWDTEAEPSDWTIDTVQGAVLPFQERVQNGKSVGVPGTLKGLDTALNKWGTSNYSLSDLIQPAIKMAEEGVEVNWAVAAAIENNANKLSKTAAKEVFLPNGTPLKEGEMLVQKDLAKTFKLIAEQGVDVFYNGEIGEALANEVQAAGGSMVADDLKGYDVTHDAPVRGDYKGYEIVTMPPPSSGGLTMLQMLKMSEMIDLTSYGTKRFGKYHNLVELMHLAYADRGKYMGDPEYADIPEKGLLDTDYLKERVKTIKQDQANTNVQPGNPWDYQEGDPDPKTADIKVDDKKDGETTHFTVADQWGNMVSYTTTIEQLFGSGIMVSDYGILLNNELTDFDAQPGGVNEVAPNKRPLSSMTPTIVLKDGKPFMTVGSPGGPTIITSVTQTIMNVIGYDMELKDAIEEPRIYSNTFPNIRWEKGIPSEVRAQLSNVGHVWEDSPVDIGNVNSILVEANEAKTNYIGAADSTREGVAIGIDSETDKSKLQDEIDKVKELNEADYTAASWEALQAALQAAEDVLSDSDATQAEVDKAIQALNTALTGLEKRKEEPEDKVNDEALDNRVKEIDAENLKSSNYTVESWEKFQEALQLAKEVLNDPNATQKEIDEAFNVLNDARDGLVKKTPPSGNDDQNGKDEEQVGGDKLPETATPYYNFIFIGLALIAVAFVIWIMNKRRTES